VVCLAELQDALRARAPESTSVVIVEARGRSVLTVPLHGGALIMGEKFSDRAADSAGNQQTKEGDHGSSSGR